MDRARSRPQAIRWWPRTAGPERQPGARRRGGGRQGFPPVTPHRRLLAARAAYVAIGLLGAAATGVLVALVRQARGGRSYLGVPAFVPAVAYGGAVLCEALTPLFHSEPLTGISGGPLARLHTMLVLAFPLSLGEIPLLDVPLFVPAGFLAVMMLGERGRAQRARTWPVPAAAALLLVFAAHFLHC